MDSRLVLGMLVLGACNAHLADGTTDASPRGDARADAAVRTPDGTPDAYVFGPWGSPMPVTGASDPSLNTDDVTVNSTQTEMYFAIVDTTLGVKQLWMSTRASTSVDWSAPTKLGTEFNVGGSPAPTEESPRLSIDDNTLYFGRGGDIYSATRSGSGWTTPQKLANVSTANYEKWFAPCSGGYYMVARNTGTGTPTHLYVGQLGGTDAIATELEDASTGSSETSSFLSVDCMTTYYAGTRNGVTNIYTATRTSTSSAFTSVAAVTDFGNPGNDNEDPWLSPDGHTFYFASARYPANGGTANTNKGVYCATR